MCQNDTFYWYVTSCIYVWSIEPNSKCILPNYSQNGNEITNFANKGFYQSYSIIVKPICLKKATHCDVAFWLPQKRHCEVLTLVFKMKHLSNSSMVFQQDWSVTL